MAHFYASFAGDAGFLGAVHLETRDGEDPVAAINRLKLVPPGDGEIMLLPIKLTPEDEAFIRPYVNRLLTREELDAIDARAGCTGPGVEGPADVIVDHLRNKLGLTD